MSQPPNQRTVLPAAIGWRIAYRCLLSLALPVAWLRLAWRAWRIPALRERWAERRGVLPFAMPAGGLWVHTVSAGETIAAAPLLRSLRAGHPALPILVTTTTHTGSERVRALLGDAVLHAYLPYDSPAAVARFLDAVRPRVAVFFETELWPNVLEGCHARGIRTALVNARLSARSAAGYARLGSFARRMLGQLDLVACQSEAHATHFAQLGVPRARLPVLGNVKFDLEIGGDTRGAIAELAAAPWLHGRHVWIAGSTHAGEEVIVLEAHRHLRARFPDALLVLVPRHPERSAEVLGLCDGLQVVRRSDAAGQADAHRIDVLLGDRMGELLVLYGVAQAAFVGGSLVDVGGHNPIEPAAVGVPFVRGPCDRNFADVAAAFDAALQPMGAVTVVADATSLARAIARCWDDAGYAAACAAAGMKVIAGQRGAAGRIQAAVEGLLAEKARTGPG